MFCCDRFHEREHTVVITYRYKWRSPYNRPWRLRGGRGSGTSVLFL